LKQVVNIVSRKLKVTCWSPIPYPMIIMRVLYATREKIVFIEHAAVTGALFTSCSPHLHRAIIYTTGYGVKFPYFSVNCPETLNLPRGKEHGGLPMIPQVKDPFFGGF
jgi:hypothetical protein